MAKAKSRKPSQLKKPRAYSLLDLYNGIRNSPRVAPIRIEDPYAPTAHAAATPVARPQGAVTKDGPQEWQTPARPRIEVLAAVRDDVAAKLFAHGTIDEPCFMAARNYQSIFERAVAMQRVASVDLEMPPIQGGRGGDFQGADMVIRAAKELKQIEHQLRQRSGEDGVTLVRDILGGGKTIELAARERGDYGKPRAVWWGAMFRRSLRHLAEISGFAVSGAYGRIDARFKRERKREQERERREKDGGPRPRSEEPRSQGA